MTSSCYKNTFILRNVSLYIIYFFLSIARYAILKNICCDSIKRITILSHIMMKYDDIIKRKHIPRYWSFVKGIHRWPHKGQWRGAFKFFLLYAWANGWPNKRDAVDLRRHRAHYYVTVVDTYRIASYLYYNGPCDITRFCQNTHPEDQYGVNCICAYHTSLAYCLTLIPVMRNLL